jgi:gas vesicle protein
MITGGMPTVLRLFRRASPEYTTIKIAEKRYRRWPMNRKSDDVMMGAALVVTGAILGAMAALLVAPQSGRQTRKDLFRYARKAGRAVEGVAGEVAGSVAEMASVVEEKTEELLEKGMDLSKESREAVLAALNEGQERLGRQRDRLAKLLG